MIDIRRILLELGHSFLAHVRQYDNTLGGEYGPVNPTFPHEYGFVRARETMKPGRISFLRGKLSNSGSRSFRLPFPITIPDALLMF